MRAVLLKGGQVLAVAGAGLVVAARADTFPPSGLPGTGANSVESPAQLSRETLAFPFTARQPASIQRPWGPLIHLFNPSLATTEQ